MKCVQDVGHVHTHWQEAYEPAYEELLPVMIRLRENLSTNHNNRIKLKKIEDNPLIGPAHLKRPAWAFINSACYGWGIYIFETGGKNFALID
jgi:hypothetical protein